MLALSIAVGGFVSNKILEKAGRWAQPEPPRPPGEPQLQRERPFEYRSILDSLDSAQFRRDVEALASIGSRVAGYEGCEAAAQYVVKRFREIGLQEVGTSKFSVATPLDQGAMLNVGDVRVPIYALWPNAARTNTLPPGGVSGPVIYAATGELKYFDGREMDGAIVLLDFNCGKQWLNAFLLNAAAVVFVEPVTTLSGEADNKVVDIPLHLPRFWLRRQDAGQVLASVRGEQQVRGRLIARTDWLARETANVFGLIPGRDPDLHREYVVVTAYYDSMSVVPQLAPGAGQTAGTAALLQMAQVFQKNPPARSVVFLATSAHHQCLQGAREAIFDDTVYRVAAMVNPHVRSLYELRRRRKELRDEHLQLQTQEPSPAQRAGMKRVQSEIVRVEQELQRQQQAAVTEGYVRTLRPRMVLCLDISSGDDQVGIFHKADLINQDDTNGLLKRRFAILSRRFEEYAEDIAREFPDLSGLFFDGVDPKRGRTAAELFAGRTALDSEVFIINGLYGVTLATAYDARAFVDTPLDTIEQVGPKLFANGFRQTRLVSCLAASALNDPELPDLPDLDDHYRTLVGSVKEFDPSSGFLPKDPVPGSIVTLTLNPATLKGVRGTVCEIADIRGEFEMRGLPANAAVTPGKTYPIQAYAVDPISGHISYAPDKAEGSSRGDSEVAMDAQDKRVRIIAFPCRAVDLFDIVDHRTFQLLTKLELLDARTDATPMKFGFATTTLVPAAIVFVQEDVRFKALLGLDIFGWRYVLLNMMPEETDDKAGPFVSAEDGDERLPTRESGWGYDAPESGRLTMTTLLAARDMYYLNDLRLRSLQESGISSDLLNMLQYDRAKNALRGAEQFKKERLFSNQIAGVRNALGYLSRAYPAVMSTANDVVKGIVFYMFLLLPFSYFMERLLFCFPDINRRIAGFFGIFVVTFALIAVVHPAFGLKKTLVVIPLGFIILSLSLLVIFIIGGRFEEEIRRLRKTTQVEHREDVGRMSAAAAAFSLGVSNMRRRKMRTILTSATLILFMFTVISFTSVQSSLRFNRINLGEQTPYRGMLLRTLAWKALQPYAFDELANAFKDEAVVLPRYWIGATMPEASAVEFWLRLTNPASPQVEWVVPTALGVSAEEAQTFLMPLGGGRPQRVGDMLVAGRWFTPQDLNVCILPANVASVLGITEDQVNQPDDAKPRIVASSLEWMVCGIVRDELFQMQDLDGEEFAPLDRKAAAQPGTETQTTAVLAGETLEAKPQKGVHVTAKQTILLPYQTVQNLGGQLFTVAMVFEKDSGFGVELVKDLILRAEVSVFVGVEGAEGELPQRWLYSSVGIPSVSGAANLVVPILIAIGIVLNTMLGSVYERTREISIYSSVGLAPVHIGVLFIAESLVYAVVGGVAGYMVGQLVTSVITWTQWLPGLTLNYSSMSAVMSSFIVMAVVVLSALYPAMKAAKMAVPDVHRRWKPQWPAGDLWEFDLPFTVGRDEALGQLVFLKEYFDGHEEGSVGVFSSTKTELLPLHHSAGDGAQLLMTVWLAPFDFGVTQKVTLQTMPISAEEVHSVLHFRIQRKSGDVSNWRRANIRFVNEIRKQCLIWRIVTPSQKETYQQTGMRLLGSASEVEV